MDPCSVGRNADLLQYTQFAYVDESTAKRVTNAATPKPGKLEEEWAKFDLAPNITRWKAGLQEAALIVLNERPELAITGKLLTRTALTPFGCEEVVIRHEEREDRSAGELVVPKVSVETRIDEQGPSGSGKRKEQDDEEQEDRKKQWRRIQTK